MLRVATPASSAPREPIAGPVQVMPEARQEPAFCALPLRYRERARVDSLAWIPTLAGRLNATDPRRRQPNDNFKRRPPHQGTATVGSAKTGTIKEAFEPRAKASGMTWEQWQELLASRTHARRLMTLEEMANVAVFMASDKASGMTGTTVNLIMGSLDD